MDYRKEGKKVNLGKPPAGGTGAPAPAATGSTCVSDSISNQNATIIRTRREMEK